MRVLHTAHSYSPERTGVAEVVRQISERLARRGHEICVATSHVPGRPSVERMCGVEVRRFRVQGNAVTGIRGEAGRYRSFLTERRWDVVAAHHAHVWSTDLLLDALDCVAERSVFVAHGLSALLDPHYERYYARLAPTLKAAGTRVVGVSGTDEELGYFCRNGISPTVIPNGVDIDEWRGPAAGIRRRWRIGDGPWIISVSNHAGLKGHHRVRAAHRRVRADAPETHSTIIGTPYTAERLRLNPIGIKGGCWYRCRAGSAVTPGFSLRSGASRPEVVSAIKEADLVLVTSDVEASPLVVLESMVAGTPWVSLDVGCVRGHSGGVVVLSPSDLHGTILELLARPALRDRLGKEGKRAAAARDWNDLVDRYETEYRGRAHV